MIATLLAAFRLALCTLVATSGLYTVVVWAAAQAAFPRAANGSLVEHDGRVVGARLVAQAFESPQYVWPRPSAVGHAAHAAGGSNLSPAGAPFRERAEARVAALAASAERRAPAELVTASGSGLDPHVTLAGALFQCERIAEARGVSTADVRRVMLDAAGGEEAETHALVVVLELNLRLDRELPLHE